MTNLYQPPPPHSIAEEAVTALLVAQVRAEIASAALPESHRIAIERKYGVSEFPFTLAERALIRKDELDAAT